jgi:hypothetical protein
MPPLTIVACFFRICITNEKSRLIYVKNHWYFLYGKLGDILTFVTLISWPFDHDVEGKVFMYQMKANMFIHNMSKFLADTTTIKFLVIFLISELMFYWA